jgi:hypothetical protein
MSLRGVGWCLLLWLASAWSALAAQTTVESAPTLEVTLVTVEPGELYWQRFGHNAILVREVESGVSVSYNFGYFDFAQQDFLLRFIRGRMLYQAVAIDGDRDLDSYLADGRRVWLQRLRLTDAAALRLAQHLHQHVQPAHRDYRYDYYRINCSTKVRDALDLALDGALRRATEHRSHGWSYRRFTRAYAQGIPWLYFGTDLALGQAVDAPLSLWEETFIPGELRRQIGELKLADGQPLVVDEQVLPAGADPVHPVPQAPDWRAGFVAAGIALVGLILLLARLAERGGLARVPLALTGALLALVLGAAGVLIVVLWFGTDHAAAWRNENLLLVSPFWWLTVPAWLLLLRRDQVSGWVARAAALGGWLAFAGIALGALLKVFRSFDQSNIEWLLLLGPLVLALRHVLARRCV